MAKIEKPLFHISGKAGDYVYYDLKGRQVVRKKPAPRKSLPSEKELQIRSKFAFITKFILRFKSLIDLSFSGSGLTSSLNNAVSVNFKNAVTGDYPDWRIDFSKLKLGQGIVAGACDVLINPQPAMHLSFAWNVKSRRWHSHKHDQIWVAVYCEALQKALTRAGTACRKDGSFILDVSDFSGHSVHVYLGFNSIFWGENSDSQYLGEVEIL